MAAYIVWKNFYSVNEPSLDAQHRQVIESINDLYDAWENPEATATTKRVLDRLVEYTQTHFDHEEKIMREAGFPEWEFDAHKAQHDAMRQRTIGLRTHLTLVTARDVLVFLKDWWLDHIQGEDKKYAGYVELLPAHQ
jgi:hemerythrin-like metal-binding protein